MFHAVARSVVAVIATALAASISAAVADTPIAAKAPIAVPQPVACPSGTKSSRDYAFSQMGNRAGFQTVCLQGDGTRVVQAGVPPPEALRIATLDAARLVGRGSELGSIAPGKLADMILVDGDPSRNIGDARRLRLVIKDGALFDPDALCRVLGIQPIAVGSR